MPLLGFIPAWKAGDFLITPEGARVDFADHPHRPCSAHAGTRTRHRRRRLAGLDREITVEPLPGDEEAGLGWRTRVQFAVRPDGVAGLRAHRSHEVIDIGECLIAQAGITELGLPARRWPGTSSVEALVATGSGERAVIVGGAGRFGPDGSAPPDIPGADAVLRRAGPLKPSNRRLTPVRGRAYLSQRAAGRDWRVSAGAFWQVHPGAADALP